MYIYICVCLYLYYIYIYIYTYFIYSFIHIYSIIDNIDPDFQTKKKSPILKSSPQPLHRAGSPELATSLEDEAVSPWSHGGFLSHGGIKSSICRWIFHEINHPFWGTPMTMESPGKMMEHQRKVANKTHL